ncbi:cation transporter [Virgibacillus sp. 179-BFC.A HS]|uniref:Cation transporter n=1 Tax=Tigheibacillus jepli TaxID=3035914 RepID=A0ABU5CJE3_9BACI|nr:cation transporter [Virgibacillus sp. 179-BFC.A HS]MDY0406476.1 cation transporter [Virgibacillus sp. 179-BFC.A HS]
MNELIHLTQCNNFLQNICITSVAGALKKLDGVSAAEVNLDAGNVDVTFDSSKVTVDDMKKAIEEQGYDVA